MLLAEAPINAYIFPHNIPKFFLLRGIPATVQSSVLCNVMLCILSPNLPYPISDGYPDPFNVFQAQLATVHYNISRSFEGLDAMLDPIGISEQVDKKIPVLRLADNRNEIL